MLDTQADLIFTGDTVRLALVCFEKDSKLMEKILNYLNQKHDTEFFAYSKGIWEDLLDYDCIVAYMPLGVVIRGISPLLDNKWVDPAVVVMDKPLLHAIPVLGGHHGGNEIATYLEGIGLKSIITTAMEFSSGYSIGIGFRKNVETEEIIAAIVKSLAEINAELDQIRVISTTENKRNEVIPVAENLKKPVQFVEEQDINTMDIRETKATIIGLKNVAEACAIYSSNTGELVLPKRVFGGVTVAIAR